MSINEIQDEIISNFELFDNWDDKYAYIIELGKALPPLSAEFKIESNIIKGCQSQVWMTSTLKGDTVFYQADSDALIVKGLISLLLQVLSNQKASDIVSSELYFIEKIGMQQHLSMTRSNGLVSMVKYLKMHALAYQTKLQA
jgi:cysteine desulfuration protein SufE